MNLINVHAVRVVRKFVISLCRACWDLWQYGLWSFQTEDTKLERFLPKNQHTWRKLLNFGLMESCQKVPEFDILSQFSMSKIIRIFPIFLFLKSGAQLLLMTLFAYCHFWSTLFSKIGPKLQTLIPNQALIYQRPFLVRKCLFPFN